MVLGKMRKVDDRYIIICKVKYGPENHQKGFVDFI